MGSEKICRAIATESNEITSYVPESPDLINLQAINIHPDESGQQWYWTPEDPK